MPPVTTVIVSEAESGQKLLQFLERRIALDSGGDSVPRSLIQRWIRKGHVRVDGGRKKPFDRISAGQKVRIPPYGPIDDTGHGNMPSHHTYAPEASDTNTLPNLDTVHEDNELLIIAKPAGLPAHGGTGHVDSVASRLATRYAGADFRPALVHRLDKNTSGLLLAAKTYEALRRLNDLVATGGMDKRYLAWVHGRWPHDPPVLLEDKLEKQGAPGTEKMTTGTGKEARCQVAPILIRDHMTLISITLITGRTHQIRVQLASRGHAIIGDGKYGDDTSRTNIKKTHAARKTNMLLHAYHLEVEGKRFLLPPPWPEPFEVSEQILHSLKP